ncbi:MAG: LamG domain-containing protein [Verrucomicrobia bacterium]|nr:LamG domain-containing protein [Verrucomicrobiota bacterium]
MTRSDHRAWLQFSRPRTWLTAFLLAVAGLWFASVRSLAQDAQVDYLTFTGDGQYVVVPHGPELNSFPFTVAFWLKTTQTNNFVGVATKYLTGSGNGWDVHLSNGYIRSYYFKSWSDRLWTGDGALDRPNGGFVADGRWHHIAYTVDASGGTFFVDGDPTDYLPWTGIPGAPTHPMELILGGTRVDKTTSIDGHFVGSLDDLRIWNRALDVIAIREAMQGNAPNSDSVLHFDFNRDSGSTLLNRAGTGSRFNGQVHGALSPIFQPLQSGERPFPAVIANGSFESTGMTPWVSDRRGKIATEVAAQGTRAFRPGIPLVDGFLRQRLHIPLDNQEWRLRFAYAAERTMAPAGEILISIGNQKLEPVRLPGGILNPILQGLVGWKYADRTVRLPAGATELEITVPSAVSPYVILDDIKLQLASETNNTTVGFAKESVTIRELTGPLVVDVVREGDLSKATFATVELRPDTAEVAGPAADLKLWSGAHLTNRIPIRFGPGESVTSVQLYETPDRKTEPPEHATLALVEVENAATGRSELGIRLLEQPVPVQLQHPRTVREGEVTAITLRLEFGDPTKVHLRTGSAGTATPGSDFTPLDQTLVLTTNAVTVPLVVLQDTDPEELERIIIEVLPIEADVAIVLNQEPVDEPLTLLVEDDERVHLVQRLFVPQDSYSPWYWETTDAPEVTRIPLREGAFLFLDSEGQPMEMLGAGSGRLVPDVEGIPDTILRVFPDGTFMGQTWVTETNWMKKFQPDGSVDPSFSPIDATDWKVPIFRILSTGETWIKKEHENIYQWQFFDRNGRLVPGAMSPPSSSYDLVGTDAVGRSYFAFNYSLETKPEDLPFGLLFRCLPDGRLDGEYQPLIAPYRFGIGYSFGPLSSTGELTIGAISLSTPSSLGSVEILKISEDGKNIISLGNRAARNFRKLHALPSGDLALFSTVCGGWFNWSCQDYYESFRTGETFFPAPALLPQTASEFSGPVWATGIRSHEELFRNPDTRTPTPALQTLTPPWYRELRTSPVPEAGFSDTGLFLPESELSVPVLRAGSTAAPASVRGRLFPRTRNGWNDAEALPFEATFPVGAAETTVNVSFLAREGAQPLREFLLRLESGTGIDISPFRACRIWVLDDQQLPAPGELRLVTGVGRDEEGIAYLIGNLLPGGGQGPRSAPSLTSTAWNVPEGAGANVLEKLLSQSSAPGVWILPIQTTGQAGFFRP